MVSYVTPDMSCVARDAADNVSAPIHDVHAYRESRCYVMSASAITGVTSASAVRVAVMPPVTDDAEARRRRGHGVYV